MVIYWNIIGIEWKHVPSAIPIHHIPIVSREHSYFQLFQLYPMSWEYPYHITLIYPPLMRKSSAPWLAEKRASKDFRPAMVFV